MENSCEKKQIYLKKNGQAIKAYKLLKDLYFSNCSHFVRLVSDQ